LWKRLNAQAAITTLVAGLVMLVLRLGSEIIFQTEISSGASVDSVFFYLATINFSHMAIFLFLFSVALCIGVSLATNPPDYQRIAGLAFGTLTEEQQKESHGSITRMDVVASVLHVFMVIGVLVYFSPLVFG
jgi:SSS family solute:Na+ symporter